jgi:hypothetical protein
LPVRPQRSKQKQQQQQFHIETSINRRKEQSAACVDEQKALLVTRPSTTGHGAQCLQKKVGSTKAVQESFCDK